MEKKRSKGVTFWGWFFIVIGVMNLYINTWVLIAKPSVILNTYAQTYILPSELFWKISCSIALAFGIWSLLIGINILKLIEKWRKIVLYYCFASFIHSIFDILITRDIKLLSNPILMCLILFFFTRPAVKEQFK